MSDKSLRKLAEIQNKRINQKLRKLDGKSRSTINSGAIATDPGDTEMKDYLIEEKTTATEQMAMSVDRRWLTKVREEAFRRGKKDGLLSFDFGCGFDCIAMQFSTWLEILHENQDNAKTLKQIQVIAEEAVTSGDGWEVAVKAIYRLLNK